MTRYLKRAGSPTSDQPVEPLAPAAQTPAQPGASAAPAQPAGGGAPAPGGPGGLGGPRQDPPAPVAEILGTIGAPILTVLLGAGLLYAINIDERCTTLSGSIMSGPSGDRRVARFRPDGGASRGGPERRRSEALRRAEDPRGEEEGR